MKQRILMCPPDYFGVDYVINPWMQNNEGNTDRNLAQKQWKELRDALAEHTEILVMQPQPRLPDMVFTANAGLVLKNKAVVSRFSAPERQNEEPFFRDWFAANGFDIPAWPTDTAFEGAGDALFDRGEPLLWQGSGFRSSTGAHDKLEAILERKVITLKLVDDRFYHLDTCFCPLPDGWLMYFPAAFAPESQEAIAAHVPPEKRIVVEEADALKFACNTVEIMGHVFMNDASDKLKADFRKAGFEPHTICLSEFMKAGGGAKCLTLKLLEE